MVSKSLRPAKKIIEFSAAGLPKMRRLEILRCRAFVDLETASRVIGCRRDDLRAWELGTVEPSRRSRDKLERVFGFSWEALRAPAPDLGLLPRKART